METEKRIGDFRVNRKVSWGITFPQNLHTGGLIQKPPLASLCAGFVHSLRVERRPADHQQVEPFGELRNRVRILVTEPAISLRTRAARMNRQVGLDDDLFDVP